MHDIFIYEQFRMLISAQDANLHGKYSTKVAKQNISKCMINVF